MNEGELNASPPEAGTTKSRLTGEERRAQILDVAATIFAGKGLEGAKTRAIAAACGVTEAVLYKHFESKEELFVEALKTRIAQHDIEQFLDEMPEETPILEVFAAIAKRILDVSLRDPVIHKLLLMASVAGTERTQSLYVSWRMPFIARLMNIITTGIERGELRPVDPLLTARAFVGLVMDCVLSCELWINLGYGTFEPDALVGNNVPIFVNGLLRERPV